ncbi:MAG: hypothetical protein ACHQ1G_00655, partial [Planctomycetota bacterium]
MTRSRVGVGVSRSGTRPAVALVALFLLSGLGLADTLDADPSDYLDVLGQLAPGDTMRLAPGDYTDGFTISGVHGTSDAWIVIQGPASGAPARILGRACCNTVEIRSGTYLAIEDLTIDGQGIDGIFAVSASGSPCHHVRIENCRMVGHGAHQATVAISTKVATWNWIIRRNTIVAAGTGMYLGNSDGTRPFIAGLIEYNLFLDSKGYNTEIKHQNSRDGSIPGIPTTPQRTIIRHNVFLKGELPNESGARPNLLLGAFPASGLGSEDSYEVYGNVFHHNHRESLLQAEGRVSIHDNVFVDCTGSAIYLADHNDRLRRAHVYNNTFYDVDEAILFADPASEGDRVVGNLMFSGSGVTGSFTNASFNIHVPVASAASYVANPSLVLGEMDFYPLPGMAQGAPLDLSPFAAEADYDRDFNGNAKGSLVFRGAYAGEGENPGWQLDASVKGQVPGAGGDTTPPSGTILIAGGNETTTDLGVDLQVVADDGGSGMGAGAQMRFSNDGVAWSPPEPYATTRTGWSLSAYGGTSGAGSKTVYASFCDVAGNWSSAVIADSIEY